MMKTKFVAVMMLAATVLAAAAQPFKVAVLSFEDQTGLKADAELGGQIRPGALAEKGVLLLGQRLLDNPSFVLVDRRDFLDQVERLRPTDMGRPTPTRPSFLHAAQALDADVVLRGSLMTFSTGKRVIRQGGYDVDFVTLALRVGLEALDAVDGSVIAMTEGQSSAQFRQTGEDFSVISEDDALNLMSKALAQASLSLRTALDQRQAAQAARPKVKLSVKTSADPALVEMDGILVGSTPLENFEVYAGDHVLTLGKPGYRDITKRILLEKDTAIEAPMMRTELSAEEMKDILEKIRLNVIAGDPGLIIHTISD